MYLTLLSCITCPFVKGTISIGVCGVFPALHAMALSASVHVHGAIVTVVMIVDGEYPQRVFI
jgi:hypothetical protein